MFERYTDRARRGIFHARYEAQRLCGQGQGLRREVMDRFAIGHLR